MKLRIGIDARWITPEVSGIGRYTEQLIASLAEIDNENEYFVFFSNQSVLSSVASRQSPQEEMSLRGGRRPPRQSPQNFHTIHFPHNPFSLKSFFLLPRLIRKLKLDIFHSTNFMLPLLARRVKLVATIHDLIPLIHPEFTPKAKKTRFYPIYWLLMQLIARKADLIISDSEHSRRDVMATLRIAPEKVRRIYVGIEERMQPAPSKWILRSGYKKIVGIQEPYFLYVGRHDPYKNILGLVHAYAQFLNVIARPDSHVIARPAGPKQSPQPSAPIPQLVVTGAPDLRYPEAHDWCQRNKLLGQVVFTGHVTDEELLALYQHALAVVLVSRYEGFGLPVLEAMACGAPVLCSNAASLPEVAGDAALLVDPDSTDSIAAALHRLHTDETLRRDLIQKGRLQAKKFSWETCARATLQIYKTL